MAERDDPAMDPFAPHLAFAERALRVARDVRPRGAAITPTEPIDTRADRLVDLDELEAIASWQGLRKAPREMRDDDYPSDLEGAMEEREPQFILRNIPRVERYADPEERLGYEHDRIQYGFHVEGVDEARTYRHEPPELLEEMNLDVVRAQLRWRRWYSDEACWERYFSREIREKTQGPLWRRPMEEASAEERQVQPDDAPAGDEEPS
ncbi:MAG: hypothetical protein ACQEXJ_01815 [Myxococcota bacterium]